MELAPSAAGLALMALAAGIIGYSKTALGGLAVIAVAIFATVLPAKESTAAILAILIVGDVVACWHYRHDADWSLIKRLLPAVVPGLVIGALFLRTVDDSTLRRTIGGVLLVLVLLQLVGEVAQRLRPRRPPCTSAGPRRGAAGTGVGFATMTANAAGAVMTLYLSASGIDKRRFVGTNAWFFLIVNLAKVPFSIALGLMHPVDAVRAVVLAPLVLLGGLLGYATVHPDQPAPLRPGRARGLGPRGRSPPARLTRRRQPGAAPARGRAHICPHVRGCRCQIRDVTAISPRVLDRAPPPAAVQTVKASRNASSAASESPDAKASRPTTPA